MKEAQGKIVLETERLILREMTDGDFEALCRVLKDEETMYAYEHGFSDEEVHTWLARQKERYARHDTGLWLAVLKETGKAIGQCGLTRQPVPEDIEPSGTVLEVGYLFERAHWGKGYAAEAAAACMEYGFTVCGAKKLYSIIRDNNLASRRVAEKNGMKIVGEFVKHYYHVDMPHLVYMAEQTAP